MVFLSQGFRNEVMNQYFSWVMPFVYLWILLQWILASKIEKKLTDSDSFCGNRIKVRFYGVFTTAFTFCFFVGSDFYFLYYRCIPESIVCSFLVFVYVFIRANTYCVKVTYSDGIIRYQAWTKYLRFSFDQITKICWEDERNRIGYRLVIYTESGQKIALSSRDFVGLKNLKESFDRMEKDG